MATLAEVIADGIGDFARGYWAEVTGQNWRWCHTPKDRPDLDETEYGAARRKVDGKWQYRPATFQEFQEALDMRSAP